MKLRTRLYNGLMRLGPGGLGLVILLALLGVVAYTIHNDEQRIEQLTKQRDEVCTRLEWDLEAIMRNPSTRNDLRARITYHHLDQGLTQLCFGKPIIVDAQRADNCWVMKGSDDCYLDLAKELLAAHRAMRIEVKR